MLLPPAPVRIIALTASHPPTPALLHTQRCLGIIDWPEGCREWGVTGCRVDQVARDFPATVRAQLCRTLRHLMAAVSAGRLAVSVLADGRWCLAALQAVEMCVHELRSCVKHPTGAPLTCAGPCTAHRLQRRGYGRTVCGHQLSFTRL